MPTERLYRLPENKRRIIQKAAMKEFAEVPYEKVSINKIIKNANISRGSFYTYFEDKQDVLKFIFEDVHSKVVEFWRKSLAENGGDFFEAMGNFFDFCMVLTEHGELLELVQKVFSFYKGSQTFFDVDVSQDKARQRHIQYLMEHINLNQMKSMDLEAFTQLFALTIANLTIALMAYYQGEGSKEELRARYLRGLEFLKHGALSA